MEETMGRLPDAELEIMLIIWEAKEPVSTGDIMEKLEGNKSWHISTVLKLLSRLSERGFIKNEKQGRFNRYTALVDEEEYRERETKSFMEKLHGNSFQSLVASLYNSHSITNKDIEEIAEILKRGGEQK